MKYLLLILLFLMSCSPESKKVAPITRHISALKSVSSLQLKFDGGSVLSIISDGAGGLYLGGDFDQVWDAKGKFKAKGVVHVLDNGYVNRRFKVKFKNGSSTVRSMHWTGKLLYLAGHFNKIGKTKFYNLARVRFNGVSDKKWIPKALGQFQSIFFHEKNIFAAGSFGGKPYLVKVDAKNKSEPQQFIEFQTDGKLNDLFIKDNYLLIGGKFQYEDKGKTHSHLMGLDLTNKEVIWSPEIKNTNRDVEIKDIYFEPVMKRLFVAGRFNYIGKDLRVNAAAFRFDRDIQFEPLFAPIGFNQTISSIAVSKDLNYLFLGGNFTLANKDLIRGLSVFDYKTLQAIPPDKFKVMIDYTMGEFNVGVIYPWGNLGLLGGNISSVNKISGPFFNFYDMNSCLHCTD